jgi:hypothetical protein
MDGSYCRWKGEKKKGSRLDPFYVLYHDIFPPNARIRKLIVPFKGKKRKRKSNESEHKPETETTAEDELIAPLNWAQRLKRVFNIDISLCPHRGSTMRVIADITTPDIIQKILNHIEAQPPPLNSQKTAHYT